MDRLVDHLFVFEGDGEVSDFPGNYSDYRIALREKEMAASNEPIAFVEPAKPEPEKKLEKRKLNFKEKREFEMLGKEIAKLEEEKKIVHEQLNTGAAGFETLQKLALRVGEIENLLNEKEMRWLELSEIEA